MSGDYRPAAQPYGSAELRWLAERDTQQYARIAATLLAMQERIANLERLVPISVEYHGRIAALEASSRAHSAEHRELHTHEAGLWPWPPTTGVASGANATVRGPDTDNFAQSFDAQEWAAAFVTRVRANPVIATDEGTMIGWFANALMRGFDEYTRIEHRDYRSEHEQLRNAMNAHRAAVHKTGGDLHRPGTDHDRPQWLLQNCADCGAEVSPAFCCSVCRDDVCRACMLAHERECWPAAQAQS